jgi:signal transduction histidine kinase/CheY-like chemotaxis protein/PAS domain-containing protein
MLKQEPLERHQKMANALSNAATTFLSYGGNSFDDMISAGINFIADAAGVDRLSVWRNSNKPEGLCLSQIYRWDKASGGTTPPVPQFSDIPYAKIAPDWEVLLANGETVNSPTRLMPETESKTLESFGIVSAFITPVYIGNDFWGLVLYEDRYTERYFDDSSAEMMRSAAFLFANAILRANLERSLSEAEKRISLMLDSSPHCCQIWDRNLNTIDCNEAGVRLYGLKNKQEYLERFFEFSPEYQPDGQRSDEKAFVLVKEAFEKGHCVFEWMHQMPDGSPIPAEVTLVRVKYKEDYVVIGYTQDLREHKKMMDAINYRDTLLNAVNQSAAILLNADIESFRDAVYRSMEVIAEIAKVDCVYLWKNHTVDGKIYCSQIFEWSPQITVFADGKLYSYNDVVPGWEEVLSKGNIINSLVREMSEKEQAHLTPSGILSILIVPIFIEDQFWGFVGYDDCHNERVFTKEEETILQSGSLLIANAFVRNEQVRLMLESMERERHLEIQKQAAQAANEAKTKFLASMSHEIRTPMNAIIGMSDLLLSEDLEIRQHRYAEDIKISANALLDIINDILDLSKIHAAKLNLVPVHYDFKVFIDNINSMVDFLVHDKTFDNKEKELNYVTDIKDDIPGCLYGDDVRLRQVLLNLLGNSVKYTKKGVICLSIDFDGSNMLITVADTGVGIPEEDLPALFDAFEQADTKKNRNVQGTGLGLTITKSLVELMGGQISVESKYGEGSSFHLTIPVVPGDITLVKRADEESNIVYAPDAQVLAVDDRVSNLTVICGLLHQCHIKADKAISGEQAIGMIVKKQYDLIFMDHMMPEMDGIEATKILRGMGVKIPIIALTANAVSGARELLLSAGMDDFLSKPIDKPLLYTILANWIPEKMVSKPDKKVMPYGFNSITVTEEEKDKLFWDSINMIEGLSVENGLALVSGQLGVYKNMLEVTMQEIIKSVHKLKEFPKDRDLKKFCIEVHGLKGSLVNIGEYILAPEARDFENAAITGDVDFCNANLSGFIDKLASLGNDLKDVFETYWKNRTPLEIPPELPPILIRLKDALNTTDFSTIYDEIDLMNGLVTDGALKEEIDNLNTALMIMNYDHGLTIINRLLKK